MANPNKSPRIPAETTALALRRLAIDGLDDHAAASCQPIICPTTSRGLWPWKILATNLRIAQQLSDLCGCRLMAKTPAFQAGDEGSTPSTRTTYLAR